ncbi:MAG: hypothetical protein ABIB71_07535 [Candidatus Woesearchaeota archaeon]
MEKAVSKKIISIASLGVFVLILVLAFAWVAGDFYMKDFGVELMFHVAEPYQADRLLDVAYNTCKDDDDPVYCAKRFYVENFNYTKKGVNIMKHNFSDYAETGINCGGATMFYVRLLRRMGIPAWAKAIHSDDMTHLFVIALVDDDYCIIDQGEMMCFPLVGGN